MKVHYGCKIPGKFQNWNGFLRATCLLLPSYCVLNPERQNTPRRNETAKSIFALQKQRTWLDEKWCFGNATFEISFLKEMKFKRGTIFHELRKVFEFNFSTFWNYGEVSPYHILIPYLYVGTVFLVLKQMFVVPAIRIMDYLAHTMSGNAFDGGILKISSQPVTLCSENCRNLLTEVLAPNILINRFTNSPLLNRNIFWHFSLSYKLFLIN